LRLSRPHPGRHMPSGCREIGFVWRDQGQRLAAGEARNWVRLRGSAGRLSAGRARNWVCLARSAGRLSAGRARNWVRLARSAGRLSAGRARNWVRLTRSGARCRTGRIEGMRPRDRGPWHRTVHGPDMAGSSDHWVGFVLQGCSRSAACHQPEFSYSFFIDYTGSAVDRQVKSTWLFSFRRMAGPGWPGAPRSVASVFPPGWAYAG